MDISEGSAGVEGGQGVPLAGGRLSDRAGNSLLRGRKFPVLQSREFAVQVPVKAGFLSQERALAELRMHSIPCSSL